jgi:L-alanine-DL-glutamate epimerase-like enolase superfamily enzyme
MFLLSKFIISSYPLILNLLHIMLITHIQLYPLEVPMSHPIKMAGETLTHAQTLLVRITDEHGRTGWGEASSAPLMTGETLASILASTEYLASKMLGAHIERPADIAPLMSRILYGNASAKACIETALMDLLAQAAGVPLYQMLTSQWLAGQAEKGVQGLPSSTPEMNRLEMLHMLASGDLDREIEEARGLRADGYRQWKIKVGTGHSAEAVANDVRRVRAICAELGGDVVSADANQALTVDEAAQIAKAGTPSGAYRGLSFLEQPFSVGMMNEMIQLHANTGVALCADESIQDESDITAHHKAGAAQGVSLKLIKLGGTQALVEAGQLCLSHGMRINLACKVAETTISAAATAHAGFALNIIGAALGKAGVAWGFSMSNRYLAKDVCAAPLVPIQGAVSAAQFERAGLGFSPETDRLRAFASKALPVREFA